MTLLIDNYDSFSYNLYQLIGEIESDIRVIRNDELTVEEIEGLKPDRIILSPGPGRPEKAGVIVEVVQTLGNRVPILGVCLGHQAIGVAYGGVVTYAKQLMHGKQSLASWEESCPLFQGCPEELPVARYHSLAVDDAALPDCMKVCAWSEDGEVMAMQHREYPVFGLQFHPESIMTPNGKQILRNFFALHKGGKEHD